MRARVQQSVSLKIAPGGLRKVRMRMAELEAEGGRRTVKKQKF